jgi:L-2,4-diaminobutyrate decarboxylase
VNDYRLAAHAAVDVIADHVASCEEGLGPATVLPDPDSLSAQLDVDRWIREGGMGAAELAPWLRCYLENTVRLHHPGELIHQVGVPSTGAAIADLVHGATNNPMAIYEMGAAGALIEHEIIRWMVRKLGFDASTAGGVLTHGGSLANLTALLAARAIAAPEAWQEGTPSDLALLAPRSAHYSVRRAAGILGIGENRVVDLEVDELERIRPDRLETALDQCADLGRRPLALVAVAGATSTGLHDDLRAIGRFCRDHGIWFHVDAAHGASAILSDAHRHLLDGIELADSVVWDAHKMLRTSGLCAAVLVRRESDLIGAFRQRGDYLFHDEESVGYNALDRAVETTKTTMGLKVFLTLAWMGEHGVGEYVNSRYELTRHLYARLRQTPGITCPYEPESNILCFRVDDGRQADIRDQLLAEGRFHIGTTTVNGERYLRVVVMAPSTDEAAVDGLVRALVAAAGGTHSLAARHLHGHG